MPVILKLAEISFWAGVAALGFAILFNVPVRTLFAIWALGALGGLIKFSGLEMGINIILASFLGASAIGIVSIFVAHKVHSPPLIFSIPAVIPMMPGAFAYRMMLGLMQITTGEGNELSLAIIGVAQNGLKVAFILMGLAVGVSIPMLIMRKETAKKIKMPSSK